ncbi:class I SAM-dependent methyltransferase [Xanthomonas cerealis]|uniref:class I SAM-dependent methyltransferase n=1 Tax=Xanthomonas cerealis TaxID=3390025 RepID=UPI001F4617AA|nr:class I SAM-dependent methyltransferase [Xanthomonas translucens]
MLEVGAGSGAISHYFSTRYGENLEVHAVDVTDSRQVFDGYSFELVPDTRLPFETASFDIVISNHVIEHVGGWPQQLRHLKEIGRVLKKNGTAYLAVPNRWMLVEPHYALPLLSWLPRRLRHPYLRLTGRGSHYDCEPLELHQLHTLLERAGLDFQHKEAEALQSIVALEPRNLTAHLLARLPTAAITIARPLLPTFICTLRHGQADVGAR